MLALLFAGLLSQTPIDPPHFEFGGIDASKELTFDSSLLKNCLGSELRGSCNLARTSFADLQISHSIVEIRQGRLYSLSITGPRRDYNEVLQAFSLKYGPPDSSLKQWNFKDGNLRVTMSDDSSVYLILFVTNLRPTPTIDF